MNLETEIRDWKRFSTPLRQADKIQFEELMTACRLYTSSAGAACRPTPSDAMFMSILLHHQKLISELKAQIEQLKNEKTTSPPAREVENTLITEQTKSHD